MRASWRSGPDTQIQQHRSVGKDSALSKCSTELSPDGSDGLFPSLPPDFSCPPARGPAFVSDLGFSAVLPVLLHTVFSLSWEGSGSSGGRASAQIPQPRDQSCRWSCPRAAFAPLCRAIKPYQNHFTGEQAMPHGPGGSRGAQGRQRGGTRPRPRAQPCPGSPGLGDTGTPGWLTGLPCHVRAGPRAGERGLAASLETELMYLQMTMEILFLFVLFCF